MTEKKSFIEAVSPATGSEHVPGPFRIRPVVVDTSFLLPDLLWCTRHLCESTFLDTVNFGPLRPFAAHHVWAEVPRKISEKAAEEGIDPEIAEAVWWRAYVPRIRFVDVSALPIPRFAEISCRDPSDAPTLALAGLLSPVVVLAADRDLSDLGVASQDWVALVRAGDEITFAASSAWSGLVTVRLGGYSVAATVRGLVRVAQHPIGQLVLGAGAIYALATLPEWWPKARRRLPEFGGKLKGFIDSVTPFIDAIAEQYQEAIGTWSDAEFRDDRTSLRQDAARILALSAAPLSRTQIANALLPNGSVGGQRAMVRDLEVVLSSSTAFVPANQRRWELGKAGPDFGVGEGEVEFLADRTRIPQAMAIRLEVAGRTMRATGEPLLKTSRESVKYEQRASPNHG